MRLIRKVAAIIRKNKVRRNKIGGTEKRKSRCE